MTYRPWLAEQPLRQMGGLPAEALDVLVQIMARICDDPYNRVFSMPVRDDSPSERMAELGDFGFIEFVVDEAAGLVRLYRGRRGHQFVSSYQCPPGQGGAPEPRRHASEPPRQRGLTIVDRGFVPGLGCRGSGSDYLIPGNFGPHEAPTMITAHAHADREALYEKKSPAVISRRVVDDPWSLGSTAVLDRDPHHLRIPGDFHAEATLAARRMPQRIGAQLSGYASHIITRWAVRQEGRQPSPQHA